MADQCANKVIFTGDNCDLAIDHFAEMGDESPPFYALIIEEDTVWFESKWENNVKDADALPYLLAGSNARTADANGGSQTMPLAPLKEEDAPNVELREAWEYYHTPRCEYPTAPGFATLRSLTQIITYDAYHKAEAFLTQPLLTIAGSVAGSKWMSDDLIQRAATTDKKMHIVEGANHMSLYDVPQFVDEAARELILFFRNKL